MNTLTSQQDEQAIRVLMAKFMTAFNAGDLDAIMSNYIADENLIIFDLVPRKAYRGAETYRTFFADMHAHFTEGPQMTMDHLTIKVAGNTGFGSCLMHVSGTSQVGKPVDYTVRVTDGYLKSEGHWLIAQEHISVPVDLVTGQALIQPTLYE